jgi:hypothetical protein
MHITIFMFEKGVMRLFGPKRDEMAVGWRRLHNEVFHNLYTSPNIIRVFTQKT